MSDAVSDLVTAIGKAARPDDVSIETAAACIDSSRLRKRIVAALAAAGITTVAEVSVLFDGDLLTLKNLGPQSVRAIRLFAPHQNDLIGYIATKLKQIAVLVDG